MKIPVLRGIVNALNVPVNIFIAHQDRRVVETQRPMRSDLRMGEKLIAGDAPIIAYRRRRQELIEAAAG
jgi:hypothetical protein